MNRASNTFSVERISPEICLKFCNTVSSRSSSEDRRDKLRNYFDLISWGEQEYLLSPRSARRLHSYARSKPALATRAFTCAIELREAIYHLLSAKTRGTPPPTKGLKTLNQATLNARSHTFFTLEREGFTWHLDAQADALDQITWFIALSAVELLTSARITNVRECSSNTCTWLFVDTTKNHSRRWCDMNDCGNRAKARRHYAKVRAASQTASRRHHPA